MYVHKFAVCYVVVSVRRKYRKYYSIYIYIYMGV
jgi:hypothetical protein